MKKIFLIPTMALLLGACVNDSFTPGQDSGNEDSVKRSYLSVSIYSPVATRAGGGVYEDGEDNENKINSIRFFFFTESDTECEVFKQTATGEYLSYIDWSPLENEIKPGDPEITVSKIAQATLGINQPAQAALPAKIIAVINPTADILALNNPSLSDLTSLIDDYYTGLHDGNFLMTNSVYLDNLNNKIIATPISAENLASSKEEFENVNSENPKKALNIYVERVLARVDFALRLTEETNPSETIGEGETSYVIYKVSSPTVNGETKEIYVKLLGWNLTATANTSRLIKEINSQWTDLFGNPNQPWNSADFHRSFWAVNPPALEYSYGSFNTDSEAVGNDNPVLRNPIPANALANAYETVYVQENAADYLVGEKGLQPDGPANPTKLILGAQLVDKTGAPLPLSYWANRYYLPDDLLIAAANVLNIYQKKSDQEFVQIGSEYLQFVNTLGEGIELPDGEAEKGYYSYVQLKPTAQGETPIQWYDGPSADKPLTIQQVNEYILNRVNYVMVWSTGKTYYYFDIKHLGTEDSYGEVGIVRNHLYKANLTSLKGLGTPVFNPNEVIYPETPDYDENVLKVDINVLQWRIVSEDYDIVWP